MSTPHKIVSNRLRALLYFVVLLIGAAALTGSFLSDTFFARVGAKPNPVAPISIMMLGTPITQNFDTLATSGTTNAWTDNSTLAGWYSQFSLQPTNPTTYRADSGGSNTGALYSWGVAGTNPVGDRALGSVGSGTPGDIYWAIKLTNDTGSTITSLSVSYTGEQWRAGGCSPTPCSTVGQTVDFQYQVANAAVITDANTPSTGWLDHDPLDFTSPTPGTSTAAALDGNAAANRNALSSTITVTVNAGQEVWLRWKDINHAGNDHGLSIDDFSVTPNGAAPGDAAPTVSSTSPLNLVTNVALNASITINFSESVNVVAGSWFTIAGSLSGSHTATVTGGPMSFILDPGTDFVNSETITVTIVASEVTDTDSNDPPDNMAANYVFSFTTVAPPLPVTPIHDIQGASHISPLNMTMVSTTGIVTALRSNGFYIQDPSPDTNDATSEGIFVFTSSAPTVVVGDAVSVTGTVSEFRPGGSGSDNLTITELTSPSITVTSSGNPLPAPILIGVGGRVPPSMVIEDDAMGDVETSGVFDPATDGIDFYESLEAMRVQVNNAVVTGPSASFGEIPVLSDDGLNASVRTTRGGVVVRSNDFNPERIFLDDGIASTPTVVVGDHFTGPIVGVMDYSFGNFKLQVTSSPTVVPGGLSQEVTALPTANQLAVATFNVENLDPNDPAQKFTDLAGVIINNLKSPDLIALEEIQDNNGPTNDPLVDASQTYNLLITAIQTAGGPTYQFRQIDPVDDQDGGEPGGNIRVGFLFRTDRGLAFVDRVGGASTVATTVANGGSGPELSSSPGRIDPTNAAFNNSRKPLAGEFTFNCQKLFVIANHFNSKGGDQPLFGHFQPPALSSEVQRMQQAQIVNNFVDAILALDPNAAIVVLGDLNDFEFSNPLMTLKGGVLNDLIESLPQSERYTYVFEGNSQALDHILVSNSLFTSVPVFEYDVVHVNSEFVIRTSDHDPQVARLTLVCTVDLAVTKTDSPDPVTAGTNLTYTINFVNNGPGDAQSVTVTDAVPANTTFVSTLPPAGWTPTTPPVGGTGDVMFSKGPVVSGETAEFIIVVKVNANTANGTTITNSAVAASVPSDSSSGNNTAATTTTVQTIADLVVSKTDSPDPVAAGMNLTYTITLTNNGPSDAQSVTLTDAVPANTTFVSEQQTIGPAFSCTNPPAGGTGNTSCTIATLAAGASATFEIVVNVNSNTANGATITNNAVAATTTSDPNSGNSTGTSTSTVSTSADIAVTKSDSPDPVPAGSNLTYTINFVNNGPSTAQSVTVTDAVPANTTFVSAAVTTGAGWGVTNPAVGGTGNVVFSKASVVSFETAVFTMVVKVGAATTITNDAVGASTTSDPTPGNNTGTATTTVTAQADLAVTKSDSPDPISAGVNLTYTINFAVFPAVSVAVQVTVVVPTGNIEPDGGTQATVTPGQLSFAVGVV